MKSRRQQLPPDAACKHYGKSVATARSRRRFILHHDRDGEALGRANRHHFIDDAYNFMRKLRSAWRHQAAHDSSSNKGIGSTTK